MSLSVCRRYACPKETYEHIMSENRIDVLSIMHKAAAKSDSIEQFEKAISNL